VSALIVRLGGPGFTTLGRAHRYWPLVHLGVALWAAVGLTSLWERWASRRTVAVGGSLLVAAFALPSPVLASIALPHELPPPWLLRASLEGDASSPLNLLAPSTGQRCTVAVPPEIAPSAYAYSGYRFVSFPYSRDDPTRARIRWADVFEEITPLEQRLQDNRILLRGPLSSERWRRVARIYGVDKLLIPLSRSSAFPSYETRPVGREFGAWAVIVRKRCEE
jgi:hypothetical protein